MTDDQRSTHHPCPTCSARQVPNHLLMCGICWRLCPHNARRAVNRAYDEGRGLGSLALLNAQRLAIRLVAERLERTPDHA